MGNPYPHRGYVTHLCEPLSANFFCKPSPKHADSLRMYPQKFFRIKPHKAHTPPFGSSQVSTIILLPMHGIKRGRTLRVQLEETVLANRYLCLVMAGASLLGRIRVTQFPLRVMTLVVMCGYLSSYVHRCVRGRWLVRPFMAMMNSMNFT